MYIYYIQIHHVMLPYHDFFVKGDLVFLIWRLASFVMTWTEVRAQVGNFTRFWLVVTRYISFSLVIALGHSLESWEEQIGVRLGLRILDQVCCCLLFNVEIFFSDWKI